MATSADLFDTAPEEEDDGQFNLKKPIVVQKTSDELFDDSRSAGLLSLEETIAEIDKINSGAEVPFEPTQAGQDISKALGTLAKMQRREELGETPFERVQERSVETIVEIAEMDFDLSDKIPDLRLPGPLMMWTTEIAKLGVKGAGDALKGLAMAWEGGLVAGEQTLIEMGIDKHDAKQIMEVTELTAILGPAEPGVIARDLVRASKNKMLKDIREATEKAGGRAPPRLVHVGRAKLTSDRHRSPTRVQRRRKGLECLHECERLQRPFREPREDLRK